jgi:hypothetical protein
LQIDSADITRDGKVSYAEFLSLWEDKKEDDRRQSMHDISMLLHKDSSGSIGGLSPSVSDDISDVSTFDACDALDDFAARGNFLKQKINSQRSSSKEELAASVAAIGGVKHVFFEDSVQTIPAIFYDANTDNSNDEKDLLVHAATEATTTPLAQSAAVASMPTKHPAVATV